MEMVIECNPHQTNVHIAQDNVEWDESSWEVVDFNAAFEENLHLDAPFES